MPGQVFGRYLQNDIFMAQCVDCGVEIGTFRPRDVFDAILRTANRGGVKCPSCRRASCFFCGLPVSQVFSEVRIRPTLISQEFRPETVYACPMCTYDFQDVIVSEEPVTKDLPFSALV